MISLKNEKELQELIQDKTLMILDFYANWCPPCRQLMPVLELVSGLEKYSKIKFVKINIDEFPQLAEKYEISSIPTLIFISEQGEAKYQGFHEQDSLINLIEEHFFKSHTQESIS